MEHKLILGGEQYLPFARSRIKALRATGMRYACQQFEVDGVSIKVSIEGDHEYIRLEGSGLKILSGLIKVGEVVELPVPTPTDPSATKKVLRSYKATQNAWDVPLKKSASKPLGAFNDETFLSRQGTQYRDIVPSMYSGLMAVAAQIALGRGAAVAYDSRWVRCHGVTLDSAGKPWIIEISQSNGVMAMPLPMTKGKATSDTDAERHAMTAFGAIPDGHAFPAPDRLEAAITSGSVLRLLTAAQVVPFFSKTAFADFLGWSFNMTGSEAHNTCHSTISGSVWYHHFKVSINILITGEEVNATAVLEEVESGKAAIHVATSLVDAIPVRFVGADRDTVFAPFSYDPAPTSGSAPMFVRHIDGVLDVVRLFIESDRGPSTTVTPPDGHFPPYTDTITLIRTSGPDYYVAGAHTTLRGAKTSVSVRTVVQSTIGLYNRRYVMTKIPALVPGRYTNTLLLLSALSRDATVFIGDRPAAASAWHTVSYSVDELAAWTGTAGEFVAGGRVSGWSAYTPVFPGPPEYTDTWANRENYWFLQYPTSVSNDFQGTVVMPKENVAAARVITVFLHNGATFSDVLPPSGTLDFLTAPKVCTSCFGSEAHAIFNSLDHRAVTGSMFSSEGATPVGTDYNFIGYIP